MADRHALKNAPAVELGLGATPLIRAATRAPLTTTVTPPVGTPTGSYDLTLQASYRSPTRNSLPFTASAVVAPPAGTSYLGDLLWLSTTNGYGPVERNTSNEERADGTKVASTSVLTNAMPAQPVTADVTGAQVVRLLVTDGGDGIDSDHADWADARLTC